MKKPLLQRFFLAVSVLFVMAANANAVTMTNDGWQGRDLSAQDGGAFYGVFRNIGEFINPEEDPVLAGPDAIEFYAGTIDISGVAGFQKSPVPSLSGNAGENIAVEGGDAVSSGDSAAGADGQISAAGVWPIAFGNFSTSNGSGIRAVTIAPVPGGGSILLAAGFRYLDSSIMSVMGHYPAHKGGIITEYSEPLPEPSTLLLMAAGLYGLAVVSIRRRLRDKRI